MTQEKPKPTKSVGEMTAEEREEETVRRYQEAIETAKSGILKKKTAPQTEPAKDSGADETLSGS